MTDGGQAPAGEQSIQKRPFGDRHVHLGMPLHTAPPAALGLTPGFLDHPRLEGPPKEQREDHDHQQAAREFGTDKRPAEQDQKD